MRAREVVEYLMAVVSIWLIIVSLILLNDPFLLFCTFDNSFGFQDLISFVFRFGLKKI